MWPPAGRKGTGESTQPMPVVQGSAPPPAPPSRPRPPAPQHAAHGRPPGLPQPAAAPWPQGPQEPLGAAGEPSAPTPSPEQAAPRTAPAPPRRGRTLLVAAGAVLCVAAAVGARTYDGYLFYDKATSKETRETVVAAGQAGKAYGIEWKATVAPMKAPPGNHHGPDVAWMQVDISEKVLDEGSATMIAKPGDLRLEDRAGRAWVVEVADGDRPLDRMEVGKEYPLQGVAVVPAAVAGEVELSFRPSTYRSDASTDDLFKRGTAKPDVEVLRFRR
ncbi:hypothetical protein SAMN05660976_07446 [Nonomuraea pusilla]|uniref:DUF4352 domain-containing protein n=1 Tax=Nonomuraea pusilla TaxID=46177 RepID=A0A1H8G6B2_9ACTN|nr:hypothetical protein SAMN05660976_07446 [Nonomuraea pusilla]